jgi:hypothetical protein
MRQSLCVLALGACLCACSGGGAGNEEATTKPIPIEEVAAPVGSALSLEKDRQGQVREESFAGVLPGNFPADVPVYHPATLVDFGAAAAGRAYVVFQTPDTPGVARPRFTKLVQARGYQVAADGATMVRGERVLRITYEDARPGTRIRIEYAGGP